MNNYFKSSTLFRCDCSINYRLSMIRNYEQYITLKNIYYTHGKIVLYKNAAELLELFRSVIIQEPIDFSRLSGQSAKELIKQKKYILGMYETKKMQELAFQKKPNTYNNYNTFLVYGYNHKGFLIWCNTSIQGASSICVPFNKLQDMLCADITSTKNPNENLLLGLPLSQLSIAPNTRKSGTNIKINCIKSYYLPTTNLQNSNIINHFICTEMKDFITHSYIGCQYQCAANLKTLKDLFCYHNLLLQDNSSFQDVLSNNQEIIRILNQVVALYAKYIFTYQKIYITRALFELEMVAELISKNRERLFSCGDSVQ